MKAGDNSDDVDVDGANIGHEFDVTLHDQPPHGVANSAAASGASLSETAVTSAHGHTNDRGGRTWLGRKLFGHGPEETTPNDLEAGHSPYGRTHVSSIRNGNTGPEPTRLEKGKRSSTAGSVRRA